MDLNASQSFSEFCDGLEDVFSSCVIGIVIGVTIFGTLCFCVIKNKCCC